VIALVKRGCVAVWAARRRIHGLSRQHQQSRDGL